VCVCVCVFWYMSGVLTRHACLLVQVRCVNTAVLCVHVSTTCRRPVATVTAAYTQRLHQLVTWHTPTMSRRLSRQCGCHPATVGRRTFRGDTARATTSLHRNSHCYVDSAI